MTRPNEKPAWLIEAAARLCKEINLPPTVKNMVPVEAAILSARAEQREEDARIAETFPITGSSPELVQHAAYEARQVAAAIRNGGT